MKPVPRVETIDGELVLFDPAAVEMAKVVAKHNCRGTLRLNADRMRHFISRMVERGDDPGSIVIVCLNVDDVHGGPLADLLMPGVDWKPFRDRSETPIARGLAERDGIGVALDIIDKHAAEKLRKLAGTAIVVVDFGVAEVFSPGDIQ